MQMPRSGAVPSSGTWFGARLGSTVSSPLALASCVVALVIGMGAFSTFFNYRALRHAGEQRARDALEARRSQLRASLGEALATADPLLEQLAAQAREADPMRALELLARMRELATARAGLSWISVSFTDGTFVGVTRNEQGTLFGQTSQIAASGGTQQSYRFDPSGTITQEGASTPTDYDPRKRDFYRLAAVGARRLWTAPYPFLPNYHTGVSRVEPVYREPGRPETLRCVLTVDFDTTGLAGLLQRPMTKHQRQLVLSADGSILAASGVMLPERGKLAHERALNWSQLTDHAVSAARSLTSPAAPGATRSLLVDGEPWRLEQAQVAELDGAPVVLLDMVPERELFAQARAEARRSLLAVGLSSLLGLLLALFLSSHIARLRKKRAEAEREAERARAQVTELGSYQLLAPLAAGGMGEVYSARHKLLARDAALKLIKSGADGNVDDDTRSALFFQEAKMLASLRSVHTVAVYDFGIADDGRYFLAMELLDGLDLDALVRQHGPQPAARVAMVLAQACDSLAEAHAAGLVHRDIKPANLFLCRLADWLDVVKVLDFGLTRAVGSTPGFEAIEGTPGYMAPEQALAETVGPASDLYSLGCVGYWLLTGRPPYEGESHDDLMEAHVAAPIPELPAAARTRTPAALAQLLTRCMAKESENRPVSAAQLARTLRRIASESSETFTEEMRSAFWRARDTERTHASRAETTLPIISVQRRKSVRKAS